MVINQRVITNILRPRERWCAGLIFGGTVVKGSSEMGYQAPSGAATGSVGTDRGDKHSFRSLGVDPKNANALMALYENYEGEIRAAAIRWFGNNRDRYEQAIHNILVAIGREAATYDPDSMSAAEWVRHCADAEARKLRERLDAGGNRGQRTRRPM